MASTPTVPPVGARMPEIKLVDPTGRPSVLSAARAERPALVYFLRASTCPVCVKHARTIANLAETGRLGATTTLLVAPGDAEAAAQLAHRVPSPHISAWASGTGHAATGLGSFLSIQHSGTFLLDDTGTVRYRRTNLMPPKSFDAQELLAALPASSAGPR